jgi:hypothetical protein
MKFHSTKKENEMLDSKRKEYFGKYLSEITLMSIAKIRFLES